MSSQQPAKYPGKPRRVLIASGHALFGQGLRSLLQERHTAGVEVVGMVSSLEQALSAIEKLNPDLVIVDYDDEQLNRDEFLARFVEGEKKMRLVLLSLQSGREALVYDRRTLAASQINDWLDEWTYATDSPVGVESYPANELSGPLAQTPEAESKAPKRRSRMKHLIVAGILVIVVAAGLIFGLNHAHLLPEQASAQAVPIDQLFHLEFTVIAFLFALIVVFMVYSVIVFRRKPGDVTDGPHMEGNTKLEVAWTVAPLITVMAFAYLGGQALSDTLRADPKAMEINVIGQQWAWRFEYPQYGIVSTTLYMPKDKQALLHLSSVDVIHSFWVPEFRVKQDALPGGDNFVRDLRVTPTMLGDFKVRCSELCGKNHALMESPVKVVSQQDFDAWVSQETGVSADPVVRGEKAANNYGCVKCHSLDGTKIVGPTWKGLFNSQVTLSDGSTVTADQNYLLTSIVDPNKQIVQSYPSGVMPQTYATQLNESTINDLVAYIMSLK